MRFISIADIVSPHGLKGAIKVYLYNHEDPLLLHLKEVYVGDDIDKKLFIILRAKRIDKKFCILNLEGIFNRNEAERIRNKKLFIVPEMLPKIPDNQVYLSLLIGYCVFDEIGREIGVVEDFINTGAQDIMIVKHISSIEFMVPYVNEFIKKVDTERGQIIINMMEGLLG